ASTVALTAFKLTIPCLTSIFHLKKMCPLLKNKKVPDGEALTFQSTSIC
ncbi:5300_t:CDS:1, partial [Funneliformis geosporum]